MSVESTPSASSANGKRELKWVNILFMTITPLAAAIFLPIYFTYNTWHWGWVPFFIVTYTLSNMAITCGYHRYFAHRSYDVHPFIEWLYIMIGAGAFQGPALVWSVDHRRHHLRVDTDDDPYSINKGFWYAHIGWMFFKEDPKYSHLRAPDLEKNPWILWQDKYYVWVASFMGFVLPGLIAWALGLGFWGGVFIGGALRIVLTEHSTFFINSACHYFGRQPYTDKNSARDSLIMAFLTFGEGYHNYHHYFQLDYRNGVRWYQWDPTKWTIQALAFFGLASRLKTVPREEIVKARLQMDERILLSGGASQEMVTALKVKLEETLVKMRHVREEYQRIKVEYAKLKASMGRSVQSSAAAIKFAQLKADAKTARQEFREAYAQWLMYVRAARAVPARA